MLTSIIGLAIMLGLSILLFAYFAYQNYQRWQLNNQIADDLDGILKTTVKNLSAIKERQVEHLGAALVDLKDPLKAMTSPAMISTMLTIMVKKAGLIRLSLDDFANLNDEDFISIYVDNKTQQLILSSRHDLVEEHESILMGGFASNDDNTFH